MRLDQSLASFLDELGSVQEGPALERVLALVGACAASLVSRAAPEIAPDASALRNRLEEFVSGEPAGPETWLPVAQEASAVFDLVSRVRPEPSLAVAVALARATMVGTVQLVTMSLSGMDDLTRTAVKTRAQGLEQRARQAEADFLRSVLVG